MDHEQLKTPKTDIC